MRRRLSLACALAALATLAPAAPASADVVFPLCAVVDPVPQLLADPTYTWLCIDGETGVSNPLTGPYCSATGGCRFILTAGHAGAAELDAQSCSAAAGQQPLCVSIDTGTIPLYRIEPTSICYGWDPWAPPCGYREVDEP